MKTTIASLVLIGAVASVVPSHGQETPPRAPSPSRAGIVGEWTLNKDLSDAQDKMTGRGPGGGNRGEGASGYPGGGGRGGMGGGGGHHGGYGGMGGGSERGEMGGTSGGSRDSEEMRREREILASVLSAPGAMTIVAGEGSIIVTTSDGVTRKYVTDGRKAELVTGDGVISYKARWETDTLIIDSQIEKGPTLLWTIIPMDGGRQLLVVVKASGGQLPRDMMVHHVYMRAPGT